MISRIYCIAKLNDCLNSQHRLAEIVPIIFAKRKRSAEKTRCCGTVIYVRLDTISRQPSRVVEECFFLDTNGGYNCFSARDAAMTFDRGQSAFQWLSDKVLRVANYNYFFPFLFFNRDGTHRNLYLHFSKKNIC